MRKGQKIHDDGSGLGPWAVGHYECTTLVHVIERLQSAPTSAAAERGRRKRTVWQSRFIHDRAFLLRASWLLLVRPGVTSIVQ